MYLIITVQIQIWITLIACLCLLPSWIQSKTIVQPPSNPWIGLPGILPNFDTAVKIVTPVLLQSTWDQHNRDLADLSGPLHHQLSTGEVTPSDAGEQYVQTLRDFVKSNPELIAESKSKSYIKHDPKLLTETKKKKNKLRHLAFGKNGTPENKKAFHEANRLYSSLKKLERKKSELKG